MGGILNCYRCRFNKISITQYTDAIFLFSVVLACSLVGCVSSRQEFRIRDSGTGLLSEPFQVRKHAVIKVDNRVHII